MKPLWRMRRRNLKTTAGSPDPGPCRPVFLRTLTLLALALLCLGPAGAQEKPKKGQPQMRTLTGIVTSVDGKPVARATVLLENTKTKQIVSFYSQPDGSYFFHELNPDVDYKVSARLEEDVSATHTLSSFDSKRETVINLKLEKKKDK